LIRYYIKKENFEKVLSIFAKMKASNVKPNNDIMHIMVAGFDRIGLVKEAQQMLQCM
jgi:pentatricopeptide repeat protein